MFRFFKERKWLAWGWVGSAIILVATWLQVQLDVRLNQWFGDFYNTLGEALSSPGSVTETELLSHMLTFGKIAALWITIALVTSYFVSHWTFRWRTSMAEHYHKVYDKARHIEGASQRVQEDTLKFARIMEGLGVGLLESIMTLVAFTPILWVLSEQVTSLPWVGVVPHSLVFVAILTALGGTALLVLVGIKLPGIEYDIQKNEAFYRKALVIAEDSIGATRPATLEELYDYVRQIHYKSYFHYFYFNVAKLSYLQGMVLVPYIALTPTIALGAVTLGVVQQIVRAFGRVESSLQYLVRSWPTIVELISVHKRLREFERGVKEVE
ncbi:MAG: transporter [Blastopirellula sp.]|nr:MAG: transporter [Blastopirellula sp.]